MAIKVKHDMAAAPAAAAGVASGRARRAMETARLFNAGGKTQLTQGAHASPAPIPTAHANPPTAHAPAPVNLELTRRENAAQEAARQKLAETNNAAAAERLESRQDFAAAQSAQDREGRAAQEDARRRAAQEEWDRQRGVIRDEGYEDLVAKVGAGTHRWNVSPEVGAEFGRLTADYQRAMLDPNTSEAAKNELRAQYEAQRRQIARFGVSPVNDPSMPNVQEIGGVKYIQSGNRWEPLENPAGNAAPQFSTDETGQSWLFDGKGGWKPVAQPPDPAKAARDKFLTSLIGQTVQENNDPPRPLSVDEINARMEIYDAVMGTSAPVRPEPNPGKGTSAPPPPPPEAPQEEKTAYAKRRWGVKK